MKVAQAKRYTEEGKKAFEENTDYKYVILNKIRYAKKRYIDGVKGQALTKVLKCIKSEEIDDNLIKQLDDTGCDIKQILDGLLQNDMYLFGRPELRSTIEQIQTKYTAFYNAKKKSEEMKDITQQTVTKQGNFFSRIFNKVKKIFSKNKTKMLPEGNGEKQIIDNPVPIEKNQREGFVEDLRSRASNPTPIRRKNYSEIDQENGRYSNLNSISQRDDNDLEL